jgi:cytochrome b subunit of formate dehydrogenase
MKTTIHIIILLVTALYIGGFKISFKPFSVSFESWSLMLSFALAMAAVFFYAYHIYDLAQKDTIHEVLKIIDEQIKKDEYEQT